MTQTKQSGAFLALSTSELVDKLNEFALRYASERIVNGTWNKDEYLGEQHFYAEQKGSKELAIHFRKSQEYKGRIVLKLKSTEPFPTYTVNEEGLVNGYCVHGNAVLSHCDTVSQQEIVDAVKAARSYYRQMYSDSYHPWSDAGHRMIKLDVNELIKKEKV